MTKYRINLGFIQGNFGFNYSEGIFVDEDFFKDVEEFFRHLMYSKTTEETHPNPWRLEATYRYKVVTLNMLSGCLEDTEFAEELVRYINTKSSRSEMNEALWRLVGVLTKSNNLGIPSLSDKSFKEGIRLSFRGEVDEEGVVADLVQSHG